MSDRIDVTDLLRDGIGSGSREVQMTIDPLILPANWRELDQRQKYELAHASQGLVRGTVLPSIEVDCLKHVVIDREAGTTLRFRSKGREEGSYAYLNPKGRLILGGLESLRSDGHPNERIYVLKGAGKSDEGKRVPHHFDEAELTHVASLIETYMHRCASKPVQIEVYVLFANRDR